MTDNPHFLRETFLPDLGLGAGMAIWGFRACARGGAGCCVVVRGFQNSFGRDGPKALQRMLTIAQFIGHHGRRKVALAMPGCARMTHDELSIIAALSAAQVQDGALCDAHMSWLLAAAPPPELSETVTELADIFARHQMSIEAPQVTVSPMRRTEALRPMLVAAAGHA